MKHRIWKFAAWALATTAILLVTCWALSLPTDPKSAQLAFGKEPAYACLALGNGDLIICDHFDNREFIHLLDSRKPMRPSVEKDIRAVLPGFTFRHLTLTSGQRIWSFELSLLIPAVPMALLAGLFFWMLRIPSVTASDPEPPNVEFQRTGIYLRASTCSGHDPSL